MMTVKVQYAKTHLSALLALVERGEEMVVSRGATPVAKLVPLDPPVERELGFVAFTVPDDFDAPLPEDELVAWEERA